MSSWALKVHPGLRAGSRFPGLTREQSSVRLSEWSVWLVMGISAACASALPDWNMGLPGHAILRLVFPMALGLSLAPRRGAGSVMGVVSLVSALSLRFSGRAEVGFGAMTSLTLTGPLLDVVLWKAQAGWRLYAGIIAAGLSSNLIAMGVKVAEKLLFSRGGGKRSFGDWLLNALWTYPLFGVVAGLLSALVWFRWRARSAEGVGNDPDRD